MVSEVVASRVAFSYESMAFAANTVLGSGDLPVPLRNALIDSFLAHSRRLLDFFANNRIHPTDVVMGDLVDDAPTVELEVTESQRDNMNRRVLHLTSDQSVDLVEWPVAEMARELRVAFELLLSQLEKEDSQHTARFADARLQTPAFEKRMA